jgi:hypothetical protein
MMVFRGMLFMRFSAKAAQFECFSIKCLVKIGVKTARK